MGLVRTCLPTLDESFGPLKIALNTSSAGGEVKATPFATFLGVIRIMSKVIGARIGGKYKQNPFFTPDSGAPISAPYVLTREERKSLNNAA